MEEAKSEPGKKYDKGKLRYDLLPVRALEEITRIFTYGANKYGDHNWRRGMSWGRVYGALQRHLNAFWKGEDQDQESGLHHLSHAGACLLFLLQYSLVKRGTDDRIMEV